MKDGKNIHVLMGGAREKLYELIGARVGKVGSFLDIGTGDGQFMEYVDAANKVGVEPDEEMAIRGREAGRKIVCSDAIEFLSRGNEVWDTVTLLDIIEHIEYEDFDQLIRSLLSRTGRIVINIPNPDWGFWNHPDHKRPYTPSFLQSYFSGFDWNCEIFENHPYHLSNRPSKKIKTMLRKPFLKLLGIDSLHKRTTIISYTLIAEKNG